MMNRSGSGFSLIELLVVLAILLILARWAAVFWAPQIEAWQRATVEGWGLPYDELRFFGSLLLLCVAVAVAVWNRVKLRRSRRRPLELPR